MSKRFVSWTAVSSRPQLDGGSPDDQKQRNLAHIEKWGGVLIADLDVPGHTRSYIEYEEAKREVEAYSQLDELIKAKAFDALICYNVGRLGRKRSLITTVIDLCHSAGIVVYRTSSPPVTLEWSKRGYSEMLIEAVESCGFENEVEQMKEHHRTGMIRRVERGLLPAAPPYGYSIQWLDRKKYELRIDESAAKAVRRAFDLFLAGYGMAQIADILNDEDYSPKRFSASAVRSIFVRAKVYAGYAEVNRRSNKREYVSQKSDTIPAIISENTLQRFLAETPQRKRGSPPRGQHLFSGVVYCTKCNRKMSVMSRGEGQVNLPSVRCDRHCKRSVLFAKVEKAILQWFDEIDQYPVPNINSEDNAILEAEIAKLQSQLSLLPAARERANGAYVDGDMDKTAYTAQIKRLDARKKELDANIRTLAGKQARIAHSEVMRQKYETIRDIGRGMIAMGKDDPATVNKWLREFIRVEFDENRKLTVLQA